MVASNTIFPAAASFNQEIDVWAYGLKLWSSLKPFKIEAGLWPPSVNRVWRNVNGRTLLSRRTQTFRIAMRSVIAVQRAKGLLPLVPLAGPIAVGLILFPPNNGRHDLDNCYKSLFDALTHAGVWQDDSQVKLQMSAFGASVRGGAFRIGIVEIPSKILPLLSYED